MTTTIRLATLDDITQIQRLNEEFWQYNAELMPYYFNAGKDNGEYPRNMISGEDSDIFVAVAEDEIIGIACVKEDVTPPYAAIVRRKFTHINDVFVTEEHRNKGVGKMLVNAVKEWSKARNHDYINLSALSNNKNILDFYAVLGFEVTEYVMKYRV